MAAADPTEDFAAWAALSARMFRRTVAERARIVHDAGVDEAWRDLDARWFDALVADLAEGRLERLDRFLALCEAARRAREAAGERVPSPLDDLFAPRRTNDSMTPPFARPLSPAGMKPSPPRPGQSSTAVFKHQVREAIAMGDQAAGWSVERYAWLCAELEVAPERRAAIWTAHAIGSETAADAVHGVWETRLARDAKLRDRHRELVVRYAAAIRRGDRSLRPR